ARIVELGGEVEAAKAANVPAAAPAAETEPAAQTAAPAVEAEPTAQTAEPAAEIVIAENEAVSVGIIGGADGPTAIFVSEPSDEPAAAEALAAALAAEQPAVNIEEIYDDIDTIVNAAEGSMSDAEKVAELDALKTELASYVDSLNAALAEIALQESALAASAQSISALESELATAQVKVDELTAAIETSEATIVSLEEQVAALTSENEANSAESAAEIQALNAQILGVQTQMEQLTAELEAANTQLVIVNNELLLRQNEVKQLEAYMLERELADGEAHAASTLNDTITVSADGVSAQWNYINNTLSGNAVVITITLDGAEIYKSEALEPGAALNSFTLADALSAGSYEAIVATSVYDANGEYMSSTRVPVGIVVG
ncbi:MAG: hypothetical protein IJA26_05005, partial [Clostridia bacterium]|nr:hypothetical protein [Clostridia bacterium]